MVALILYGTLVLLATVSGMSSPQEPQAVIGFLCADNGTFSGLSELAFISEQVQSKMPLDGVEGACQSAFVGSLQLSNGTEMRAVLATTGIGELNAALCTSALLRLTSIRFKTMIFVGTSGFSPVLGGFEPLAPGGCSAQTAPSSIAVGSVCVTAASIDGTCGECVSNPYADREDLSNECSRPNCANHTATSLFGSCSETASNSLQAAIVDSNEGKPFPKQTQGVLAGTTAWWSAHEAVDENTRQHPPTVPSLHTNCVEVDVRQIWVGAPMDYLCREYTAELLGLTPASALCVAAMEASGFLAAVRTSHQPNIEVAVVRAASNWDMFPLSSASANATNNLRWLQNTTYVTSEERLEFIKQSYQYAVQTSNQVVLNYIRSL